MPALVCPNCCSTSEVKLRPYIIVIGFITLVVGIVDLIFTGLVYSALTNYHYGAWWSAMVVVPAAAFSVFSLRRGFVISSCVLSYMSIVISLAGLIVDGSGLVLIDSLEACASASNPFDVSSYEYSGNSAYSSDARYCIELYYKDYRDCYCVNDAQECFFFEGLEDCNDVLDEYTSNLSVAVAFDLLCFFGVLALAVVTSISICCPFGFRKRKTKEELRAEKKKAKETGESPTIANRESFEASTSSKKGFSGGAGSTKEGRMAEREEKKRAKEEEDKSKKAKKAKDLEAAGGGSTAEKRTSIVKEVQANPLMLAKAKAAAAKDAANNPNSPNNSNSKSSTFENPLPAESKLSAVGKGLLSSLLAPSAPEAASAPPPPPPAPEVVAPQSTNPLAKAKHPTASAAAPTYNASAFVTPASPPPPPPPPQQAHIAISAGSEKGNPLAKARAPRTPRKPDAPPPPPSPGGEEEA